LTDILREWRFGFDDYYDVFIWDFVPGEPHMELYNIVVMVSPPIPSRTTTTDSC
jgi:hypothetical protein